MPHKPDDSLLEQTELADQTRAQIEYLQIIESMPLGMHMYRLEAEGRLVFIGANPAASTILGVDMGQFIGLTIEEAFPPLAETEVPDRYREAAAHGIPWQAEQISYSDEQISGAYAVYAFQTSPGRMVAAFQDITERKITEFRLQKAEDEKATVLNALSELVVFQGLDHRIIWANQAAGESVGLPANVLVGRLCYEVWFQADQPCQGCPIERAYQTQQPAEGEVYTPNDRVWFLRGYPVIDAEGTIEGIVELGLDITERKRIEQQRLALIMERERGNLFQQFINSASHDLNTPLTTLKTSLYVMRQLLERHHPVEISAQQMRHVDIMEAQTERLEQLWRDMLQVSRLEVAAEFKFSQLNLNTLVEQVLTNYRKLAEQRAHTLTFIPAPTAPQIMVDAANLARALGAVVENALLYTPMQGVISLRVQHNSHQMLIEVRDNGPGIAAEHLPHIFDHFFRIDPARSTLTGRAGLGLTIAKKIVEAHGGIIDVASEVGVGSTFQVRLPLISAIGHTP